MLQTVRIKRGRVKVKTGLPSWREVKTVDYVDGDLCRVSIIERHENSFFAIIRPPRESQKRISCDRCPGQHSSNIVYCTGNMPYVQSFFKPGRLYSIESGEDVGTLVILDRISQRGKIIYAECAIESPNVSIVV